ncbi:MAG: FAD-dependent oxidoreductase [Chloroflexota bacterium]
MDDTFNREWNEEADIVVTGYGGAGAATAITAHDEGADVLILEKAPRGDEGGNTRVSGNGWLNLEPVEAAITYLKEMCGAYTVPEDMIGVWAEEMSRNTEWIRSLGGEPVESTPPRPEFPDLPGAECVHSYRNGAMIGNSSLWLLLKEATEKRGIRILYGTAAKRLVQDPNTKEILGVKAEQAAGDVTIKARKAVVMTCGGFGNNREMMRDYLTNLPYGYPLGTPYNTGDGIRMALDVGADLWHMQNISGMRYSFKLPERDVAMYFKAMPGDSHIAVAGNGERFVPERAFIRQLPDGRTMFPQGAWVKHGKMLQYGQWITAPTPPSIHWIFDEKLRVKGPIFTPKPPMLGWAQVLGLYTWSQDNSREIEMGWIKRADTIGELAEKLGIDPKTLAETVSKYNRYCEQGRDEDFGRDAETLEPITEPPYYGMPIVSAFLNTQGGPRRNERAQVVNSFGEPIPRLYSAGELGSIYSFLYQAGGNIGECMAFGRIAGRNAVTLEPWG